MAFASSIRKAQLSLKCQLCDEVTKIRWKCLDCDSLLCDKCKSIHNKVKTQLEHSIIDLKKIGTQEVIPEPKIELKAIRCSKHRQQVICIYCRDCQKLACPTCLSQDHKKHELEDLSTIYDKKVQALEEYEEKFSNEIFKKCEHIERILDIASASHEAKYEEAKQKIKDREKILKDAVSKQIQVLSDEVEKRWNNTKLQISHAKSELAKTRTKFQDKTRTIHECKQSNDIDQVLNMLSSADDEYQTFCENKVDIPKKSVHFVEGNISEVKLQEMMGSFKDTDLQINDEQTLGIKFEVSTAYQTEWDHIVTIVSNTDDSFYMSTKNDVKDCVNTVFLSDKLSSREIVNLYVYGMAVMENGTLLVSLRTTVIHSLSEDGKLEVFKDMSTQKTWKLHVTTDQCILVHTFWDDGTQQIVKLGHDREVMKIFKYNKNKQNLFTQIMRITTDKDDNISVIDWKEDRHAGQVISLGKNGELRWIYKGLVTNQDKPFLPLDMLYSSLNNLMVYDLKKRMMHILDPNGQLLACQDMLKLNIKQRIFCMAKTANGQIIVGCRVNDEEKKRKIKAKLHILKFSGC